MHIINPHLASPSLPASDGGDYLQNIPGFSAIRNGGANSDPVLRGLSGSWLNIVANGTSTPGACSGRMDPPTSYLSPQTFDKITVIKGPGTVLWGPIGSAGTVLFERNTEPFTAAGRRFQGELTGSTSGRNDQLADLALGTEMADFRLTAQHAHADDYKDGLGHIVPSRWDKWNLDTTLGWHPNTSTHLALDMGVSDGQARYAGRNRDGARFRRESLGLRFHQTRPDAAIDDIRAQFFVNLADHVMDNYSLRQTRPGQAETMSRASNVERLTLGGRAAWRFRLTPDAHWTSGVDAESQRHRSHMAAAKLGVEPNYRAQPWKHNSDRVRFGTFGELHTALTERDRLIGGVRVDYTRVSDYRPRSRFLLPTTVDRRTTWLASGFVRVEHDLASTPWMLSAGLGHVARFPDHWELFSADNGSSPNSNAFTTTRPERTTQLDIGARYEHGQRQAWLSAYLAQVNDFILFNYGANNTSVHNVKAHIAGAEMGGDWPLSTHWHGGLSLASAWGHNRSEHKPLPQIPPFDTRLSLRYTHGKASAGALWRIVPAQHRHAKRQGNAAGQDFGHSTGFGILSMNAAYALSPTVRLSVGIDNIFNKAYAEHLNKAGSMELGYPAQTPFLNPGRSAWAKLVIDLS